MPDEASSQPADVTPDIALTCPGQPGCACLANAECGTNLCIDAGDGTKVCATLCVDSCAAGQSCAQIPGPSGNLVSVCVARWPRLCDPCAASKDCASLGLTGSACVDAGAQGRFCGSEGISNVKTASSFRSNFGSVFGVNLTNGVLKGVLARAIVVADEKGKVLHTELVSEIASEPNYDAAVNSLR